MGWHHCRPGSVTVPGLVLASGGPVREWVGALGYNAPAEPSIWDPHTS
jgi:hypothetical protein